MPLDGSWTDIVLSVSSHRSGVSRRSEAKPPRGRRRESALDFSANGNRSATTPESCAPPDAAGGSD
jgi:hypothetical protein